jgi:Ca2+-binding EF-hand superfamily protein
MSEAEIQALEQLESSIEDFRRNGNVEAARQAFNSFDQNHDNRISKDEVFQILRKFLGEDDPEVQASAEAAYKASDANADGTLDFEEFQVFLRTCGQE